MDCSICFEEIHQNSEETIVINSCNHRFHQRCLEPWLLKETTCPNCRGPLRSEEETKHLLRNLDLEQLDKIYLTYALYTWILRTYNGVQFRRHSTRIHSFLSTIHLNTIYPLHFSMSPHDKISLTSIKSLRLYCSNREKQLFEQLYPDEIHRLIVKNPRFIQIQKSLQERLDSVEFD